MIKAEAVKRIKKTLRKNKETDYGRNQYWSMSEEDKKIVKKMEMNGDKIDINVCLKKKYKK